MFLLKKIFSRFLFPVPLCVEILLIGLLLLWFTRKQKTGKTLVTLAGVLLFLFSSHFFSGLLLTPLESRYPPLFLPPAPEAPAAVGLREVKFIVVLGSGFTGDASRPVAVQLDDESIARLVEGVRVSKVLNCCKLILSGGLMPGEVSPIAQTMAQVAQDLGVRRQDMILEAQSRDTEDEARLVAPIVGKPPFILVTEASHMPRALALLRKLGTHPIADPVSFRTRHKQAIAPYEVFPDAEELSGSERAVYEYMGLAWAKIRGKI
jgi:uncharacterized SAM-binding protein YcdF (DUF218 family)